MSKVAVARDTAPSVKILDQTFGNYDHQAIRVVARYEPLTAGGLLGQPALVGQPVMLELAAVRRDNT